MIQKRKHHRRDIKYIKPKSGERFVALTIYPFFWKFLSDRQKYNYHTKQNAYWCASCLTPSVYEIVNRLVQFTKIDLCIFDNISLQGIGHIHLPFRILRDIAYLNNLKCEWHNEKLTLKEDKKYTKKILQLSNKIACKLHKFIWNVIYYTYLELNDNEENEEKYINQTEMEIKEISDDLYENLYKTFIQTGGYEWKH